MTINCVWEHNGNDTLLYATNFVGHIPVAKALKSGEKKGVKKGKKGQRQRCRRKWVLSAKLGGGGAGENKNRDRRRNNSAL